MNPKSKSILIFLGLLSLTIFAHASVLKKKAHSHIHAHADPDYYNYLMGDFNGDKNQDFVRQRVGAWANDEQYAAETFLSNGKGVFTRRKLTINLALRGDVTNVYVGDFNGDGMDDLLRQEKGAWVLNNDRDNTAFLLLSDGKGDFWKYVLSEEFNLNGDYTNLYIGDFNGDGKDDILRQEKGEWAKDRDNTATLLLSTGTSFRQIVLPEDFGMNGDVTTLSIGDFDGDGKDDILKQERGIWGQDEYNTANVLLSTGEGFKMIMLPEDFDLNGDLTTVSIGDFNGDGKDDILRRRRAAAGTDNADSASILLSQGNGEFQKIVLNEDWNLRASNTNVYVADYDGDGKDDFIRQEKGESTKRTVEVCLSTGNNFVAVPFPRDYEMSGNRSQLIVGDFNGDKKWDFLQKWEVETHWLHISQGDGTFV